MSPVNSQVVCLASIPEVPSKTFSQEELKLLLDKLVLTVTEVNY